MKEKRQFNVRLKVPLKDAVISVCDSMGWTRDDVAEVGFAALIGVKDPLIEAKREKIAHMVGSKFRRLSFDLPGSALAPAHN